MTTTQDTRAADTALTLRGLDVTYRPPGRDPVVALRNVGLDVPRGSTVAVVGESGSGKSTLLHALLGLLPSGASVRVGHLQVATDGGATTRAVTDPRGLRGHGVGLVPQDPTRALDPLVRVGQHFRELYRHLEGVRDREEARRRTHVALGSVGVDRPELRARQFPHELSGGLLQRVLVALALVGSPRLLLADEPTSNLDTTVQRTVLDLLDSLQVRLGLSVLVVTHDIAVAAERSDHLVVMRDGAVVEAGPTADVVSAPRDEYTWRLLHSLPSRLPPRNVGPAANTPIVLAAEGLAKTFGDPRRPGSVRALDGLSLQVRAGRTTALVGQSGAGKSTALRLLCGLERPSTGTLRLHGRVVPDDRQGRRDLARVVGLVYQNPRRSLNPSLDVRSIVAEPLVAAGTGDRRSRAARTRELLESVGLATSLHDRRARELSGGQLQRVAIARALATRPEVVVLDEPVSALDQSVQFQVLELLTELQTTTGVAYVLVSHDIGVVRAVADDVVVLHHGEQVDAGPVDQVFTTPTSAHTRDLLDAVPAMPTASPTTPPTERNTRA